MREKLQPSAKQLKHAIGLSHHSQSELVASFCTSPILHFIMVKKNIIAKYSLFVRKQGLAILPRMSIKTIRTEAHLTINHD